MPGRRSALSVVALAAVALGVAGCGGSEPDPIRIGVLTDCQGPLRAFEDAELSGAELPFIRRGGVLAGSSPTAGVQPVAIAGRDVELVRGCSEVGEHTVFVEEARRLIETEHVDAIVGGASVVLRDVARRYPTVPFVGVLWDDQGVTLRRPARNVFRFGPDAAQQAAGLGAYAYNDLGWRRAAILAGDQQPGWEGAAAFAAEFCALGGSIVRQVYRSMFRPERDAVARVVAAKPDGVAVFLNAFDQPVAPLAELAGKLDDPGRQLLVWATTIEDGTVQALGAKLDDVVGSSFLPATRPSRALRDYLSRHRAAFPQIPNGFSSQSWVIGYHDAVEALLVALEHVDADVSDGRRRLLDELGKLRLDLPGGKVELDANRQGVRAMSLVRIDGGSLRQVRSVPAVEQTFGGLLSSAPPPGPNSQPCRRATPPSWAR